MKVMLMRHLRASVLDRNDGRNGERFGMTLSPCTMHGTTMSGVIV